MRKRPEPDVLTRDALAGYDIGEEIGAGGFATVHRATNRRTRAAVVVKRARPGLESFLREEIAVHKTLRGKHIVRYIADGLIAGTDLPFLVLADGGSSLAQRFATTPASFDQALEIARAVKAALGVVHKHHRLHLDISPDNVLIGPDDIVRLADFGAQRQGERALHTSGSSTVLASRAIAQHAYFSAPEVQGRFREQPSRRSDIYSLALTLAAVLHRRGVRGAIAQARNGIVPDTGSEEIDAVLRKSSSLGVSERHRTVAGLVTALQRAMLRSSR